MGLNYDFIEALNLLLCKGKCELFCLTQKVFQTLYFPLTSVRKEWIQSVSEGMVFSACECVWMCLCVYMWRIVTNLGVVS